MDEIIGTRLGPYHPVRLLARGGMSEIYLASSEKSEQFYAIKVVQGENREDCLRFQREVQTLVTTKHSHIIPTLDYGHLGNIYYYVMPYIKYGSLKERIAAGPLSIEETGAILTQVADALHFLHARGTIHRDIKPGNILLNATNHAWLADFGLAKKVGVTSLTAAGRIMGTPYYMAPELVDKPGSVSSDIYALGVVVYEMLTGRVPFQGRTPISICLKHLREPLTLPSHLNPQVSPALDQVLLSALAKTPGLRFSTPCELAVAYQAALDHPEARAVPWQTNPPLDSLTTRQIAAVGVSRRKTTYARLAATATMLFALALASLGMVYTRGSQTPVASAAQMVRMHDVSTPIGSTSSPGARPANISATAKYGTSDRQSHYSPGKNHNYGDDD